RSTSSTLFPSTTLFRSSLVVALVTALLLNALFRIGTKQTAKLEATLDQDLLGKIFLFCRENGAIWGARRDVMDRVVAALTEAGEDRKSTRLNSSHVKIS